MKARPRAPLVLKIVIPALAVMVPVAAFAVALDYSLSCSPILGCSYTPPHNSTSCGYAERDIGAANWLSGMSNEFAAKVNAIPGHAGSQQVEDSSMLEVCDTHSFNAKCYDNSNGGINWGGSYVGLLALHGSSFPFSDPTEPTFNVAFSAYNNSNNISGSGDCIPQMFGKMDLGLPYLKFLMVLSCDSMNASNDLPSGSNQQQGWMRNTYGAHIIAGFSGLDHTNATTANMDAFIAEQTSLGIGHSWMKHFTYFSPTGNDAINGSSDCAVPMLLGNSVSDAAGRWGETINNPNAKANPNYPTGAAVWGYYCNCCAAYSYDLPGSEGVHCTPNC